MVYALLVTIGETIGYIKAKNNQSLVSGLGSGFALTSAWYISFKDLTLGLEIAALIALALLVVSILRFRKTGKFMPAISC